MMDDINCGKSHEDRAKLVAASRKIGDRACSTNIYPTALNFT
ncbi:hypothetical protein [Chlorogloea sp. CCALA 695]|nr:hypothetical protein [Chlorogloea sp. CCALA 695]